MVSPLHNIQGFHFKVFQLFVKGTDFMFELTDNVFPVEKSEKEQLEKIPHQTKEVLTIKRSLDTYISAERNTHYVF